MSGMQVSRPMLVLLGVTVLLTVSSYGVRSWRESAALPPVIEGAVPARPAQDEPLPGRDGASQELRSADLLRPIWPDASTNAMAPRTPLASPVSASDGEASATVVAPSPGLPPPNFRFIGRYVDGKKHAVFFAHEDKLILARRGETLPDGFVLKAIHGEKVTVLRPTDGHLFELTLEAP